MLEETQIRELQQLVNAFAEFPEPAVGETSTYQTLTRLVEALSAEEGMENRSDIEALCRKIQVAKRVDSAYGKGWKKLEHRVDIDPCAWPVIIWTLIGFSEPRMWVGPEAEGLALKCMNAAFVALDLAREASAPGTKGCQGALDAAVEKIGSVR